MIINLQLCMLLINGICSVWQSNFKQWNKSNSLVILTKTTIMKYLNVFALPLHVDNFWPHPNLNKYIFFFHPIQLTKYFAFLCRLKLRKSAFHGHENNYCDLLPSEWRTFPNYDLLSILKCFSLSLTLKTCLAQCRF